MRPRRKPIRSIVPSTLIVVEGETEEAFCIYLKEIFSRGVGMSITVENARGGSPEAIVNYAKKLCQNKHHDRKVIFLDGDRSFSPKAQRLISSLKVQVILSSPCVEGLFLHILEENVPPHSDACKKVFHEKILDAKEKTGRKGYYKALPYSLLLHQRAKVQALNELLQIFRNEQ
jgi:hypothetical protein